MNAKILAMSSIFMIALLAGALNAAVVGTSSIRAPAVILENRTNNVSFGSLTKISLTISNGNGSVSVTGPFEVANSTRDSAITAVHYALSYLNLNGSALNFNYTINSPGDNVSGPSAGAAMALLAISALQHKPLRSDFTMTGTISANGSIGEIGGVYDKSNASVHGNLNLILVPYVPSYSYESLLYSLTQASLGIPLVQVKNITQAEAFAFNSSISGMANATKYAPYTDYHVASLQYAPLNCSAQCNEGTFNTLVNATFYEAAQKLSLLNSTHGFDNISSQLSKDLNQSGELARKGYLYVAADFAFLDYIDAYYFSSHNVTTKPEALSKLSDLQSSCGYLTPPQLTSDNYVYVLNAELRQLWANYTINSTYSLYNSSELDTDTILRGMFQAGQASGWCILARTTYTAEENYTGYAVQQSDALKAIAESKLNRVSGYGPSMYSATAANAYDQGNYAVAILDADFGFVLSSASSEFLLPTANLTSMATRMAANATYGVWATQYANEAMFYVHEAMITQNATDAHGYATQAYSSALLAHEMSNDTATISSNLKPSGAGSDTIAIMNQISRVEKAVVNAQTIEEAKIATYINYSETLITAILALAVLILFVNIALLAFVLKKLKPARTPPRRNGAARRHKR